MMMTTLMMKMIRWCHVISFRRLHHWIKKSVNRERREQEGKGMAAALSLNGSILCKNPTTPPAAVISARHASHHLGSRRRRRWWGPATILPLRRLPTASPPPAAGSPADDSSAPFEMSLESALKLLGVSEGASFDDILRAKNAVLASCKDDQEAVAQVHHSFISCLL